MFTLEQVVPWGRSFDEYRQMFALTGDDLDSRILGCGDGPANFNAEATRLGAMVISCDPIYQWTANDIRDRIAATHDEILDQTRQNIDEFVWDYRAGGTCDRGGTITRPGESSTEGFDD